MHVCSSLARRLARRAAAPLWGGVAALALLGGTAAHAATLTVTDTSDSASDTGSLRHAVNTAQPGDTIIFKSGLSGVITLDQANGSLAFDPPTSGAAGTITVAGPGPGKLAIDGGGASTVLAVNSGGTVSISGLTIQNGRFNGSYGGGGVDVENGSALALANCTLSSNTAPGYGYGGGLYIDYGCQAALTGCAVVGNSAGSGGGIYVNGTLTLLNSTVANNTASTAGAGVYVDYNDGGCALTASTIADNTTVGTSYGPGTGGGLEVDGGSAASLQGSLVAGNTASGAPADVVVDFPGTSYGGTLTSDGYNLVGADSGDFVPASTDQVGTPAAPLNAKLDPNGPALNGGVTPTVAVLPGSPALDKVAPGSFPTTDQRGAHRPANADGKADIGAFEAQASDSITVLTSSANPALQGQNVTFTARVYTFTGTPTGSIKFATGSQSATVALNGQGIASVTTNALSLGLHTITAAYSGDPHFRAGVAAPLVEHIEYASKTLSVTDKTDNPNDPGSIRSEVNNAQPGSTISFPNQSGTITLTGGPLVINNTLTLSGPGASTLALDGNKNGSVVVINGGNVTLSGLTFQNGLAANNGGAIDQEAGTLTVTNCALLGSTAGYDGGGLYSAGTATLSGDTVANNTASGSGGGVYAVNPITLTGCTLTGNAANDGQYYAYGGGIYGSAAITLSGCTVSKNTATGFGGGVYSNDAVTLTASLVQSNTAQGGDGGGVYAEGTFTASVSALLNNTANGNAGGAYTRVTYNSATGNAEVPTLTGCLVSGNTAQTQNGGGLYADGPLTLSACLVSGNTSALGGGGIYNNDYSDPMTLTNCTVANNTVTDDYGGGLYAANPLTLTGCTLSGNTAAYGGGGLYASGTAVLTNCTVANNTAQGDNGGGLYDDGTVTLKSCTLTGNSVAAGYAGGGLYVDYFSAASPCTASLQATILAGNTAGTDPDVSVNAGAPAGSLTSGGYNLIGLGSPAFAPAGGDQVGTAGKPINAKLDPNGLQYNGGLTETVALASGSPALDKVPAGLVPKTDQRGASRPGNNDGKADIGAYESQLRTQGH